MQERADYYAYLHREADTGRPFYVGKGKKGRAYSSQNRNKWWRNITNKHGFVVDFIAKDLTQPLAIELEELAIASIPGLCNIVAGGTWRPELSDESKKRIAEKTRARMTGSKLKEETKQKLSLALRGKKMPPGFSDHLRTRVWTDESRGKVSASRMGMKPSHITRQKQSESAKARSQTDEGRSHVRKLNDAKKVKVRCLETGQVFDSYSDTKNWLIGVGKPKARGNSVQKALARGSNYCMGYHWEVVKQSEQ